MESNRSATQYPVSVWEGMAIATGAIFLVVAGLMGLADKAIRNANDAERAEAIAQSIMFYNIPGGSEGLFGLNIGSVKMAVVSSPSVTKQALSSDPNAPAQVELLVARTPLERKTVVPQASTDSDFNILSLPGFSISYEIQGEFQASSSRQDRRSLCGVTTPITIREGTALLPNQTIPVPAVRYEANAVLDAKSHVVILMAIGQNANQTAAQVFNSLECR